MTFKFGSVLCVSVTLCCIISPVSSCHAPYTILTMMFIYGESSPPRDASKIKCANALYDFNDGMFNKILATDCDTSHGEDRTYGS